MVEHLLVALIEARDGRSFLEIIIAQIVALRRRHEVRLPLVLMNSDATREARVARGQAAPKVDAASGAEVVRVLAAASESLADHGRVIELSPARVGIP